MIEIKGTKTTTPEAVAAYDKYVLKSQDKKTATPLYFSMFLTGIALYLKSIFPNQSEAAPIPEDRPASEEQTAPKPVQVVAQTAPADPETQPEPDKPKGTSGSGGRLVDLAAPASFTSVESPVVDHPAFDFSRPDFLRDFGDINLSFTAANDNPFPVRNSAEGGGNPPAARPAEPGENPEQGGPDGDDDDDDDTPPANRAPRSSGPVYLYDVYGCAAALIALSDLLRNASDPDGDILGVGNVTISSGTLTRTSEGWVFNSAGLGPVTVTYQISDGKSFITQTAHFSVLKNKPIVGTDGNDLLVGSNCADEIDGRDGDDNIDARSGNDAVNGGDGNDHIIAGSGDDIIRAGFGDDVVFGGAGADQIWGEQGNDRLFGDQGRDIIFGGEGHDRLWGGDDDDLLFGEAGDDEVDGEAGNDLVDGGDGNDTLRGGDGNDRVLGQAGADRLDGGKGNDFLAGGASSDNVQGSAGDDVVAGDLDQADDVYDGGADSDTLDYSSSRTSLRIDLAEGQASGCEIGNDEVANFEVVKAGGGDDSVGGSDLAEELYGNAGDDIMAGKGGDDRLDGGDGGDRLSGGAGSDKVSAGAGNDTVVGDLDGVADTYDGGSGTDTIDYSAAQLAVMVDLVEGVAESTEIGTDHITGFEVIEGGAGSDVLAGSSRAETIHGNQGDDSISGGAGNDRLFGGGGNDTIADGEGNDCVSAGDGDDLVQASADGADDRYEGDAGTDTLDYSASAAGIIFDLETGTATGFEIGQDSFVSFEQIVGGAGDDRFVLGAGPNILRGGDGDDTFEFQPYSGESSEELVYRILDFMVGDRIKASKYEIFEDVLDSLEDRFDEIYNDDDGAAQPSPIRITHEGTDELQQTLIEIDADGDQSFETTIALSGHHILMVVENA